MMWKSFIPSNNFKECLCIMYSVFLADDEKIIRQGLHYIIDWNQLGFNIIGEAADGEQCLRFMEEQNPDIVLIDIKMPKLSGLEVIRMARERHYHGKIIILSGYSDFKYAQEAIRYDVNFYLTKPIDEFELEKALSELRTQLDEEYRNHSVMSRHQEKLRKNILSELLTSNSVLSPHDIELLDFDCSSYRVVLYEKYSHSVADISYNLPSMLRLTNQDNTDFETLTINNNEVVILKGSFALTQFQRFIDRMNSKQMPQKGSPLDSLFLTCGREVTDIQQLSSSYHEALQLMERRFFCRANQHTIDYISLPDQSKMTEDFSDDDANEYCTKFVNAVWAHNQELITVLLSDLEKALYYSRKSIPDIKIFLADLFIRIKEQINFRLYPETAELPSNTQIMEFVQNRYYLYQILNFYSENLAIIIASLKESSKDSITNMVAGYIQQNYMENLRLENLAALFGYNSSYLGKIFTSNIGINFNSYLDKIRVQHATEYLQNSDLKVYEIASRIGYKSVDAFHEKFKKVTGQTPGEYKKSVQNENKNN